MTAIGKYNLDSENSGKLFVVGNGTDNQDVITRSDAFVVKDTGECNVNGQLNISSIQQDYNHLVIQYKNGTYTNALRLGTNGGGTTKISADRGELHLISGDTTLRLNGSNASTFTSKRITFKTNIEMNGQIQSTEGIIIGKNTRSIRPIYGGKAIYYSEHTNFSLYNVIFNNIVPSNYYTIAHNITY